MPFLPACKRAASQSITITPVNTKGEAVISIPLALLASSVAGLKQCLINVEILDAATGTASTGLIADPDSYYHATAKSVKFMLQEIASGQEITITLDCDDGNTRVFSVRVSDTKDGVFLPTR
jgi:hypothetical protein